MPHVLSQACLIRCKSPPHIRIISTVSKPVPYFLSTIDHKEFVEGFTRLSFGMVQYFFQTFFYRRWPDDTSSTSTLLLKIWFGPEFCKSSFQLLITAASAAVVRSGVVPVKNRTENIPKDIWLGLIPLRLSLVNSGY